MIIVLNELLKKMDDIKIELYEIKKDMDTDILYKKYCIKMLNNYDFNDEFKNLIINNVEYVLHIIKRFIKIIEKSNKNNYLNYLNNDIYADDDIGITLKKIHYELLNYITNKQISSEPETKITNKQISIEPENNIESYNENESDDSDESFDISDNNYLRPNQLKAIEKTIEQNFVSGINCQIMGAGKSLIILKTIQSHYDINKTKKLYIICTERIDILKKLFLKPVYNNNKIVSYTINQENFTKWKTNNIIDIEKFIFINYLTNKKFNPKDLIPSKKPILLIINNAYLKARNNYTKINRSNIGLIMIDECHLISGDKNYDMFRWFKYGSLENKVCLNTNNLIIHIIGFSATPMRETKKSSNQLKDIFSDSSESSPNNKLNLISNYTFIDGLIDRIILPFKHIIIENKTNNIEKDILKVIFNKYILSNDELPYKKGVCWDKLLENIEKNRPYQKLLVFDKIKLI